MNPNQIHFTLQGKGGVGKTLVSAIAAQYFREKTGQVDVHDTDPVNDTLSQYASLRVHRIAILNESNQIDAHGFDSMMELLLAGTGVSVVDNGASTFVPLMAYMTENRAVDVLQEAGKTVYVHSVLTGGQALTDTVQGLEIMLKHQRAPVIVWINEFFGEVARDGKRFTESGLYREHQHRIAGIVTIARGNADTFGKDMEVMVKHKMTFDEVQQSDQFGIMAKQRLKMVKQSLFTQLDAIEF